MNISGGINIYPEEIEEILLQHPAIEEACVFAEPGCNLKRSAGGENQSLRQRD